MKKVININEDWTFSGADGQNPIKVNLPHTWNSNDGATGGDNYLRAAHRYTKIIDKPQGKVVYLEIKGANSTAQVLINDVPVAIHHGGFSTFRVDVTNYLTDKTTITVIVDNSKNETVYPQTADFTFFGGIYRDLNLIVTDEIRFDPDFGGKNGLKITPRLSEDGVWKVEFGTNLIGEGTVTYSIYDESNLVEQSTSPVITLREPHLWHGIEDPHLYTAKATVCCDGEVIDEIEDTFGLRTYQITEKGFVLNGKPYPLRGVCRHQDRKDKGYAIDRQDHDEDMQLIKEIGANTVRLAHYQHDDYFYDLCDKEGMVVWAEIPYISRHMPAANDNTETQITELINQQYNHASIVVWGISNEITMFGKHKKDMVEQHVRLNDICHELDDTRLTTLACYSMCTPSNKTAHLTDVVSWNLYLGWYVPFFWLNDLWFWYFRKRHPHRPIGLSEYGAEGMPNLHSLHPKRGDNTEEYQCIYHEYMLEFFKRNNYLWATHVWNMFDFAADARNQGGEPGMNHKGLVTYDRKLKKDAFYLYKAYWSNDPFVHICGKRFANRTSKKLTVKIYSNQPEIDVKINGEFMHKIKGDKIFEITVPLQDVNEITVYANDLVDSATFYRVDKKDTNYVLQKTNTKNWQK